MVITNRQLTVMLQLRDRLSDPLRRAQKQLERLGGAARREQSSLDRLWRSAEAGAKRLNRAMESLGRKKAALGQGQSAEDVTGFLGGDIGHLRLYIRQLQSAQQAMTSLRLGAAFTAEEQIAAKRAALEQGLQARLQTIRNLGDQERIRQAEALAARIRRIFEFGQDRSFWGGVSQWAAQTQASLTNWAQFGRQMAQTTAQNMGRSFRTLFFDLMEGRLKRLSDYFKSFAGTILRALNQIMANRLAQQIFAGLASLFGSSGGTAPWDTLTAQYNSMFAVARGGVLPGRFLPLRAFQTGGIASRPTLGLIGEGGRPEAVVPLPDSRHIPVQFTGGGAQVINQITINNNTGTPLKFEQKTQRLGPNIRQTVIDITNWAATSDPTYRRAHGL
jgi:hypothetical protein